MRPSVERNNATTDLVLFIVTMLVALILHALPSRLGGGPDLAPAFPLIALFIWSVRQPWFIAPPVLLLVGVLQDLLAGAPMGVWAFAFLVAFSVMRLREADGAGGEIGPLALRFTLTAIVAFGAAWGAGSFAIGAPVAPGPLITEAILTILLFPIFAWLFARRKERSTFS